MLHLCFNSKSRITPAEWLSCQQIDSGLSKHVTGRNRRPDRIKKLAAVLLIRDMPGLLMLLIMSLLPAQLFGMSDKEAFSERGKRKVNEAESNRPALSVTNSGRELVSVASGRLSRLTCKATSAGGWKEKETIVTTDAATDSRHYPGAVGRVFRGTSQSSQSAVTPVAKPVPARTGNITTATGTTSLTNCNEAKMLVSEYSNNFANSTVQVIDFPVVNQSPVVSCSLGEGSGNDGIAIDPVKNIAYSISKTSVKVYDMVAGTFTKTYSYSTVTSLFDVALSADGNYLYLGSQTGGVLQVDVATGNIVSSRPGSDFPGGGGVWGVAVDPATGNVYVSKGYNIDGSPSSPSSTISYLSANLTGTPTVISTLTNGDTYIGLTFDSANTLWAIVSKNYNNASAHDQLVHMSSSGSSLGVYDIPYSQTNPYGGNGNAPFDIAQGPDGNIYFTSFYGPCVTQFTPGSNSFSTYIPYVPNSVGKGIAFTCNAISCPNSCSLTATATPTACNTATNQYSVSGTISLTATSGRTATLTDGPVSTTVSVAASATSVAYSLTGLSSGTGSHTVTVSLPGCGTATATYTAPAACLTTTNCNGPTYLIASDYKTGMHIFDLANPSVELESCLSDPNSSINEGIAIDPVTNLVYYLRAGNLTVFDANTKAVSTTVSLSTGPNQGDIALSPDRQALYVSARGGIFKFDLNGTLLASNTSLTAAWGVDVNPVNGHVFITTGWIRNSTTSSIYELDPGTLSVVNTLTTVAGTGNNFTNAFIGLKFAPDGTFWVARRSATSGGSDVVLHYTSTGTLLQTCAIGNTNSFSASTAYSVWKPVIGPDGSLYVSSSDNQACIWKIDPATCTSSVFIPQPGGGITKGLALACQAQVCLISCSLTATATPTACNTATNQYSVSGTISLTATSGGTATLTDGPVSTTVSVAASATSVAYSLTGLSSGTGSHTVTVSLPGCGTATATYTAPASCTVAPDMAIVVGMPVCSTLTNRYTATGTVSLTNAVAGNLTITDNGNSLTTISVNAGQTSAGFSLTGASDATSHTVVAVLNSLTATTAYTAPMACTVCSLSITTTSLPNGQVNTAYSQTIVTSGATVPLTYTVLAGSLPAGLSLDPSTGVISGTPTVSGTTSFTVKVTDGKSCSEVAVLSVTTSAAPVCSLTATATPTACNTATNRYSVTGTVSATNTTGNQSLTISVGSISTIVGLTDNGPVSYTLNGLNSDGLVKTVSIVSSATACGSASVTYTAPASCTQPVGTQLTLNKWVDKSKANVGDVLTYTLVLTNVGTTPANNVVVTDSSTTGLGYVTNSVSAPAGTTFTAGSPVSSWSVASIAAGQSLSLTFQARADSSGILYNRATIPGDTATVCTSIPVVMCVGDVYTFRLTAAPGRSSYKWYRNNVELVGQTTNTLDVTGPGTYSLATDNNAGQCPDFSCCPFIIQEDSLPVFNATATPATCVNGNIQTDGKIGLSGFKAGATYQYSLGTSFNAAASLSGTAKAIPADGVIVSNLASPSISQAYTVRVYNASGCYTDQTVQLAPTVCECPAEACLPFVIKQTKRPKRIGDLP